MLICKMQNSKLITIGLKFIKFYYKNILSNQNYTAKPSIAYSMGRINFLSLI